ncbi:MAG: hypothetical protein HYZ37_03470 [Candidatus Solibacter usitatus]|nr:hypothetical protein [Candidatus Solibacter usitatus]
MISRRALLAGAVPLAAAPTKTVVSIAGDAFRINGKPTYAGRTFEGLKIEGLLLNSRMVQGIFDDENPETVSRWKYPDTGKWSADRNTREFLQAMPVWRKHGLLSFTICLQGGSPEGYSKLQPWHNSAIRADGSLKPAYMKRLERILNRADQLGMTPMVGLFYFGQDQRLADEAAVRNAVKNSVQWLRGKGYRNLLIEIANECDNRAYDHAILKPDRIPELIELARTVQPAFLVGTSFNGGSIPAPNVVRASDFVLIHGNGVSDSNRIKQMVDRVRQLPTYRPMPILFNEDDHFDFTKPVNNMRKALEAYASWGYFDPGKNDYRDGYQCPPVRWDLNTDRKKEFFQLLARVTGA